MNNNSLRLFRVYSINKPALVILKWAHDAIEAVIAAKDGNPKLARLDNVKAFPAR